MKNGFKSAVRFLAILPLIISSLFPAKDIVKFVDKIPGTSGLSAVSSSGGGLVVNADDSHWLGFFDELALRQTVTDYDIDAYVRQYENTQVTDIMFNIFGQSSDVPSNIMTFRGDKYLQKTENGIAVDYSEYYAGLYNLFEVRNIDPFAVWFDECRRTGINPWISIRMNDCHLPDSDANFLRGDLFYEAKSNGWMIGEDYDYYRNCFDYSVEQVRKYMLDYIEEQLLRYDVYGLELDWMREIYCFDYKNRTGNENIEIINNFMRDINATVKRAETKWGHDIKISARLMRDIEQNLVYGFDALTWNSEKLVDSITVTPRWSSCDSALPIADWIKRCDNIEIWAGIETYVKNSNENSNADAQTARGYAAQYLTAGANKIYLFNYMLSPEFTVRDRNTEVYNTCGDLNTIMSLPRRHVVTYQDTVPDGWEAYSPLPIKITAYNTAELKIETGYIPDGAELKIFVGTKKKLSADKLRLTFDGRDCLFVGESEIYGTNGLSPTLNAYAPDGAYIYEFRLADAQGLPNYQTLIFENTGILPVTLNYAEIAVVYS